MKRTIIFLFFALIWSITLDAQMIFNTNRTRQSSFGILYPYDFFISSSGLNTNNGLSVSTPVLTLDTLAAKMGRFQISKGTARGGLKYGDLYRGMFRLNQPHITLGAYGISSDKFTHISSYDIVTNWTLVPGKSKTYFKAITTSASSQAWNVNIPQFKQIDSTLESTTPLSAITLHWLANYTSNTFIRGRIDSVEKYAGTFYFKSEITDTLWIHPWDNGNPNTNHKRYEYTTRDNGYSNIFDGGLVGYENFSNIDFSGGTNNYGCVSAEKHASLYKCIIRDFGVHGIVINSGVVDQCVTTTTFSSSSSTAYAMTFYDGLPVNNVSWWKNSIYTGYGGVQYSHQSGPGYAFHQSLNLYNVKAWPHQFFGFAGDLIDSINVDHCYLDSSYYFWQGHGNNTYIRNSVGRSIQWKSGDYYPDASLRNKTWIYNFFLHFNGPMSNSTAVWAQWNHGDTTNNITELRNCIFYNQQKIFTSGSGSFWTNVANSKTKIHKCIFIFDNNASYTSSIWALYGDGSRYYNIESDSNVFINVSGSVMQWPGTSPNNTYNGVPAYVLASGQDRNSAYFDLTLYPAGLKQIFIDPANGDFRFANTREGMLCAFMGAGMTTPPYLYWKTAPSPDAAVDSLKQGKLTNLFPLAQAQLYIQHLADSIDSDVAKWRDSSGITSPQRIMAASFLVRDLKVAGLWDSIRILYPMLGLTLKQQSYNIKSAGNFNLYSGTGIVQYNNYLLTYNKVIVAKNFLPSVQSAQNRKGIFFYNATPNAAGIYSNGPAVMALNGSNQGDYVSNISTMYYSLSSAYNGSTTSGNQNPQGLVVAARTASNSLFTQINGQDIAQGTTASTYNPAYEITAFGAQVSNQGWLSAWGYTTGISRAQGKMLNTIINKFEKFIGQCVGENHTYYVSSSLGNDFNNGLTQTTSFATIARAQTVAKAGDTIALRKGDTWYYNGGLLVNKGGTVNFPITYDGLKWGSGDTATISCNGAVTNGSGVASLMNIAGCSWVTVQNLKFNGGGRANYYGPVIGAAGANYYVAGSADAGGVSNIIVQNCTVKNIGDNANYSIGILVRVWGNDIDKITIKNNTVYECASHCISLYPSRIVDGGSGNSITNSLVSGNICYNWHKYTGNVGYGLHITNKGSANTFEYNTLRGSSYGTSQAMMIETSDANTTYFNTNLKVRYNTIIHNQQSACIYLFGSQNMTVDFFGNLLTNVGSVGTAAIAIRISDDTKGWGASAKVNIYNNTVYEDQGRGFTESAINVVAGMINLYNNIVYNPGATNNNDLAVYGTGTGVIVAANNLFFMPNVTSNSRINGTYYTNANIRTTWPSFVIVDPVFVVNFTDFHIQASSPAKYTGTTLLSGYTKDITGKTYNNPPSIGAYEY